MQIASLHLDTYRIVKHLEAKGYTEKQAEGFIEAVEQIDLVGVATKQDVKSAQLEMEEAISELRSEMQKSINELRSEMQKSISELRVELRQHKEETSKEFAQLREDFSQFRGEIYKAMFYQSFAIIGLTVTLLKFLG